MNFEVTRKNRSKEFLETYRTQKYQQVAIVQDGHHCASSESPPMIAQAPVDQLVMLIAEPQGKKSK